jgi:predicted MFS family arabinose efflux permease
MPPSTAAPHTAPLARAGATSALAVLTAMNLLNYLDRYVPSAVKDLFKHDLGLTDAETSYPTTAFVLVYMLASPLFGALADRHSRPRLVAVGVALWSAATAAAAFANGFWTFLVARALVGVGEAAYATLSPSILSDHYPAQRRNHALTVFYLAIPVGSALGFGLGGFIGARWGWRAAFLACGLPGLVAALAAWFLGDPPRGQFDAGPAPRPPTWPEALALFARNRTYVVTVAGYAAVTFASGALAEWFPTFLHRHRGYSLADADLLVGATSAAGGLLGTFLGGTLADRVASRTRQPYLATSGLSMLGSTLFAVVALTAESHVVIGASILLAQVLLWFYNGPVNALIVNSVGPAFRARAMSFSILAIHLFGDAASPSIVGLASERTGRLGPALALVPVTLGVGAAIWLYGWRRLPEAATEV